MAADIDVAEAAVDGTVSPGTCSVHGLELVTHRRAGYRRYGAEIAVVCPDPEHQDADRDRCRWCGGPLVPPGVPRWSVSDRRTFCSSNHRLKAHRAKEATR